LVVVKGIAARVGSGRVDLCAMLTLLSGHAQEPTIQQAYVRFLQSAQRRYAGLPLPPPRNQVSKGICGYAPLGSLCKTVTHTPHGLWGTHWVCSYHSGED